MAQVLATAAEIAAEVGLGRRSLHTYLSTIPGAPAQAGRLKPTKNGPGHALWPRQEVLAWLRANNRGTRSAALKAAGRTRAAYGSRRAAP